MVVSLNKYPDFRKESYSKSWKSAPPPIADDWM